MVNYTFSFIGFSQRGKKEEWQYRSERKQDGEVEKGKDVYWMNDWTNDEWMNEWTESKTPKREYCPI